MRLFFPLFLSILAVVFAACEQASPISAEPADGSAPPPAPIARCINISNALEAPREGDWGYTVREADLRRIKAAGFDTIRLPVKWSAHASQTAPYGLEPAILVRVDAIVNAALRENLQVIINVHHYDEINTDPTPHIRRLKAIWTQLSVHYRDAPDGVIFEVLNEPYGEMTVELTDQVNNQVLAIIRATNSDRWVILGSSQWGALEAWVTSNPPRDDPRVMGTFHYYAPYEFTHQGAAWIENPPRYKGLWGSPAHRAELARDLETAARFGAVRGLPVFLGEFGVYRDVAPDQREAWLAEVRETAETLGMGWCHWGFAADFRAYDLAGERWDPGVMNALGLPVR